MDKETSKGGDKMNFKSLFRLGLLFLLASAPAQAFAQDEDYNFYINFNLGFGLGSGVEATDPVSGFIGDFNTGFVAGVGLGYRLNPHVRLEALFTQRSNEIKEPCDNNKGLFCISQPHDSGEITATSVLINAYYDFHIEEASSFFPFIGFGLGGSKVSAELDRLGTPVVNDSATVLAYQFTLGLGWKLQPGIVTLAFKRFGTQDPEMKNLSGQDVDIKFNRSEFVLGWMWTF